MEVVRRGVSERETGLRAETFEGVKQHGEEDDDAENDRRCVNATCEASLLVASQWLDSSLS